MPSDPHPVTTEPRYLDLSQWPRRESFEYFRHYDKPYFNICTRVDVAPLRQALQATGRPCSVMLACHHLVLRLSRQIEPLRYRIEQARVRIHDILDASITVLRDDQSLGFALLRYREALREFAPPALAAIEAVRTRSLPFEPLDESTAVIHFTTLPWIHFTSFSHARNWGREDAIPKFAFGRFEPEGARLWMPMSVEVHHALMDGLHLGQFVQAYEAALREPQAWVGGPSA
jgi:chloramphenicol O-acetyltransferase type A